MATISNTPRPGYAWDATDNCWYPIGTGPHTHSDYITQSTAINPAIVDAKGDLIVGSAADTVIRKPVGTDGQLLYADSTATGGIKWDAAPASGGMTLISTTTLTGSSITISSIPSTYKQLYFVISDVYNAADGSSMYIRLNSDTANNYSYAGMRFYNSNTELPFAGLGVDGLGTNTPITSQNTNEKKLFGYIVIDNYSSTGNKSGYYSFMSASDNNYQYWCNNDFMYKGSSAISSITFLLVSNSYTAGTIRLYGVN